jgi:hypothetical protein
MSSSTLVFPNDDDENEQISNVTVSPAPKKKKPLTKKEKAAALLLKKKDEEPEDPNVIYDKKSVEKLKKQLENLMKEFEKLKKQEQEDEAELKTMVFSVDRYYLKLPRCLKKTGHLFFFHNSEESQIR